MSNSDQFAGMTVNERLAHFGLFHALDAAVYSGDLSSIVAVLQRASLSPDDALATAQAILKDPGRYGFGNQLAPN